MTASMPKIMQRSLPVEDRQLSGWHGARRDVALTVGITALFTALLVGPSLALLDNPLRAGGDPLAVAAAGSDLDWTKESFGYPFGMTLLPYFPTLDFTQLAMASVVSLFTDDPYVPAHVVWLVSYPITAACAWWVFRLVGAPRALAISFAVAYTFIPFHSARALTHIYLASPWSVALAVGLAILVGSGRLPSARRGHAAVLAVAVVIAFSGIYYAFFAVLLIAFALIWRFATGATARGLVRASYPAVAVAVTVLVGLLFQAIATMADPPDVPLAFRNPGESALFSGSLAAALTPSPMSDVPGVATLTDRYTSFVYENEAMTYGQFGSMVTSLCAIIFLGGMVLRARRRAQGRSPGTDATGESTADRTSSGLVLALLVGAVLFFSPWSLNFLFALFATPGIRSWNRLLPFILLLLMCGAVTVLREVARKANPRVTVTAVVLIAVITVLDGVTPYRSMIHRALDRSSADVSRAERYAAQVNASTPGRCGVLQLPYVPFPEAPPPGRMEDYEHFVVALANPDKYWSYGAVKATSQSRWASRLQDDLTPASVDALRDAGFCGVHVDLDGYRARRSDGRLAVMARMTLLLGPAKVSSGDRWHFFAIDPYTPRSPADDFRLGELDSATREFLARGR